MREFASLLAALEAARDAGEGPEPLVAYCRSAPEPALWWAIHALRGEGPRRAVSPRVMREARRIASDVPDWLFEESYGVVGDLSETIALVLPRPERTRERPLEAWMQFVEELRDCPVVEKRARLAAAWQELDSSARFVLNRLCLGGLPRVFSRDVIERALAEAIGVRHASVAQYLDAERDPRAMSRESLRAFDATRALGSGPFPFRSATRLDTAADLPGEPGLFEVEHRWRGARAQIVKRGGFVNIWGSDGALLNDSLPEVSGAASSLAEDVVLDGVLLVVRSGIPGTAGDLAARLSRARPSSKALLETPVAFIAFDILECGGVDLRALALRDRRPILKRVAACSESSRIAVSPAWKSVSREDIEEVRRASRVSGAHGVLLRRSDSTYEKRGEEEAWWELEPDPLLVPAVLLHAHLGSSGGFEAFTFAGWRDGRLVPIARAPAGAAAFDEARVDAFVAGSTLERFGPVRSVEPRLVFEIAFDDIERSKRHRSGLAVREPRVTRFMAELRPEDAVEVRALETLLRVDGYGPFRK